MSRITVVIPLREGGSPETTLRSLGGQTFKDFDIVVSHDREQNANAARNNGFREVDTEFVLFSDDDIDWVPSALQQMVDCLDTHPEVSYAYGAYEMDGKIQCNVKFDPDLLRRKNYISTMSLIRAEHFPYFDEEIHRLQDWELYLTMLERGHTGIYVENLLFHTQMRPGITYGDNISWQDAVVVVQGKHGIA